MDTQVILKERVETLLKESLFCANSDETFLHPAVIGDCVKSLIGTDLGNPYDKLINWVNSEIKKTDKKEDFISSKNPKIQTTSYKQLQEALVSKDRDLVCDILTRLNSLTDGTQLMEVLIHMSLHQTGRSFIPIWRIYKVLHFINLKDQLNAYKVMCNFILNDDFREDAFTDKKVFKDAGLYISNDYINIAIYAHILDCKNHTFIRQKNLSIALNHMIVYIAENKAENNIEIDKVSTQKDRKSVLDKIRSENLKLSKKNVFVFDCIRMLIKNNSTISDEIISCMYEKLEDN